MRPFPNLLIVDDTEENLIFLESVIRKSKVNLIRALSGFEALERIEGMELALAIIDVNMPGMNGYELAEKINGDRLGEKVPVIFITASHIRETDALKGYGSGAVDYILKPFNYTFLQSKINVFLDLYNQRIKIIKDAEVLKKSIDSLAVVHAALKKSEEKFRSVTLSAKDAIITADSAGIISGWNKGAEQIFGYTEKEVAGKELAVIMPSPHAERHGNYISRVVQGGEYHAIGKTIELSGLHKNGNEFPIELSLAEWSTESGRFFTGIIRDISDRKRGEEALRKSEELFRSVVNNSLDLTTLTDAEGKIVFISPQCEKVVGYSADTFIGKTIPEIIHPEDVGRCQQMWEKVLNNDLEIKDYEYRIIDGQGETRWVSHSAKLININGKVLGIQNTISNITERKKAEEAIKVSEEKYRTMLNASPDGILIINMKGVITEVSDIAFELLGAEIRDDLVGKKITRFIPPDEKSMMHEIIERTLNEGLAQNVGIKIRKKQQTLFAAEISTTLIQDPNGAPLSFMVILRDISQRKKMETKQMHADRMANLGEMASGIAHEINQPLNIISLVMDKILFESAKTETIEYEFLKKKSDKIFENITRMRNIIDHIRAFSRSHEEYVLTAFDVNTSIENATSMIMAQFKHLGITLNVQLGRQIPQILGNIYKLEQVILNLLVNAKDAVIEKKNKRQDYFEMIIGVESYLENQLLIVEITDNGIGISNDDIQHVILPFYTTKDEGQGTGLGLTICYQIIKEMGGTIEIISDTVHGTKIKLLLEIQRKK
ncbi:MAG: PAS domain S-box protein [Bacteroidota bacterium]